jgi:hypothetical protein
MLQNTYSCHLFLNTFALTILILIPDEVATYHLNLISVCINHKYDLNFTYKRKGPVFRDPEQ